MKKKLPEKSNSIPEYDSQRQQNVLLERIEKKVDTIAEGHSGLVQNIGDIKAALDEHKTRFDRIEMVVSENRKDIKELKAGQKELKVDVTQLKTDVTQLKTDVTQLKTDVTHLKTGQEEIKQKLDAVTTNHEHRIQKLESVR